MVQPERNSSKSNGPVGVASTARKPKIERHSAGSGRPALTVGVGAQDLPVLFLGRRATADRLMALLEAWPDPAQDGVAASLPAAPVAGDDPDGEGPVLSVVTVTSRKAALAQLRVFAPRMVLVETEGQAESGVRFCETVRYRLPTAMIYAVAEQPPATSFGFDGVLSVPWAAAEVYAAVAGAQAEVAGHLLQRGPIRLNTVTRTVITPNGRHHMTPKQCALLYALLLNTGQVMSRRRLMADVWETSYLEDTRTLDVHIRWLRERIEPDPSAPVYLLTVRGKGYILRVE